MSASSRQTVHPAEDASPDVFAPPWPDGNGRLNRLLADLAAIKLRPEPDCVAALLAELPPTPAEATALAATVVERLRGSAERGLVERLLREYSLSSPEGVALMCLAEALLRIPDNATRDRLIRDKIGSGDWDSHLGASPSFLVNAATWGLFVTGRVQATPDRASLSGLLRRAIGRRGEPLVRAAMNTAMGVLGRQFVLGETIDGALAAATANERDGFRYSFDMLGEAALTARDARSYLAEYETAIRRVGAHNAGRPPSERAGVSVKLSALHPRYERAQLDRVRNELWPVLRELALLARSFDVGLSIDAEEADRLELSVQLLDALCRDPALAGWNGIGFVIQAYSRRTRRLVDGLVELARDTGHRLMIRLVKGAYWDSEIKKAQEAGLADFPVFTRKLHTDLSYLACARALLANTDAVFPQFATHNAQTAAAVAAMAGPDWTPDRYEFQCLHGMGEPLYRAFAASSTIPRPCRIYAPVGTHETLLAYLVRRLLENGANSSFVNRIADPSVPVTELVADPVSEAARAEPFGAPHLAIAAPEALFGSERRNSSGMDLTDADTLLALGEHLAAAAPPEAAPILAVTVREDAGPWRGCFDPSDRDRQVGRCQDAGPAAIDGALGAARAGCAGWAATPAAIRAGFLRTAADRLEAEHLPLMALIMREAGKTAANAVGEIREAVDFLRFYAAEAVAIGETDAGSRAPLGVVACISPWNFPLAIFIGQLAAALAAGNVVVAKPAEETPLVAAAATRLLLDAGIPADALQLLPGDGSVGGAIVADARVDGVMFTGSSAVAKHIAGALASRADPDAGWLPLIAETGGQNAMIADSSALTEQVVIDVLRSAFDSAGQRCSALRVLCLQRDSHDKVLRMLLGAMTELRIGDPARLATDVGPVISDAARDGIEAHVARMAARGHRVHRVTLPADCANGSFVAPAVIEINGIADLGAEVFGPVLHVLAYDGDRLPQLVEAINATGYGLTFGVHTRVDATMERALDLSKAGNRYVNRNMVGAVVGSQPFGGSGLSGTGPKAGGPLILHRLRRGGTVSPLLSGRTAPAGERLLAVLPAEHRDAARRVLDRSPFGFRRDLPGPVGERDEYALHPRGAVLCVPADEADLAVQLAAVLSTGNRAVVRGRGMFAPVLAALPELVAIERSGEPVDAALAAAGAFAGVAVELARDRDAVVPVHRLDAATDGFNLEWLLHEVSVCVNTTAAGGNASLMAVA